ncbi:hypothetical protein HDV00_003656 [Rhizophlyctis rosea]|nr:hypothetical protein HDV00_003656 [Rhizophlyctis rosea]
MTTTSSLGTLDEFTPLFPPPPASASKEEEQEQEEAAFTPRLRTSGARTEENAGGGLVPRKLQPGGHDENEKQVYPLLEIVEAMSASPAPPTPDFKTPDASSDGGLNPRAERHDEAKQDGGSEHNILQDCSLPKPATFTRLPPLIIDLFSPMLNTPGTRDVGNMQDGMGLTHSHVSNGGNDGCGRGEEGGDGGGEGMATSILSEIAESRMAPAVEKKPAVGGNRDEGVAGGEKECKKTVYTAQHDRIFAMLAVDMAFRLGSATAEDIPESLVRDLVSLVFGGLGFDGGGVEGNVDRVMCI